MKPRKLVSMLLSCCVLLLSACSQKEQEKGQTQNEQAKPVNPKPSFAGSDSKLQLADLDADGGKQFVSFGSHPKGYFELSDNSEWQRMKLFKSLPNIDFSNPNTKMLDLDGDGRPELVVSEEMVFNWYMLS